MQYLRQSTASQSVLIGPYIDDTDGKTAETGLTIANTDIRLSKNGANIAAKNSGGGTHDELGYYAITLDATDTNTVGRLQVMSHVAGALPVYHEFQVLEEATYDFLFANGATPIADINAEVDTGISDAALATAAALATVDTVVDGIQTDLDNGTDGLGALLAAINGLNDPTAAAIADAVWDELQSGHVAAGSFGEIATEIASILTDTGTTLDGKIDTIDSNVDAIKVVTDALTSAAAAKLATSAGTIVTGTVSNAVTTPTTTVFAADDITEATADHYNGRVIIFTSGALSGQATDISDYALDTGEGKFTVTAMTEAPANNDTFVII